MKIKSVVPVPYLDSRGGFTIKVTVELESGAKGWGAVPKGATPEKLKRLGLTLLEEQEDPHAVAVEKHVANFKRNLAPKLRVMDASDQRSFDEFLSDYNTRDNWSMYGINVVLAASIALARAVARERRQELFEYVADLYGYSPILTLPVPITTVLEGGPRVANDLDFQAIMIAPVGALSIDEAHRMADAVFFTLRDVMKGLSPPLNTSVGEQGGFVPRFLSVEWRGERGWRDITFKALDLVARAVESCGYRLGEDVCLAMDWAMTAQSFDPVSSQYTFIKSAKQVQKWTKVGDSVAHTEELIDFYGRIRDSHAVWSIEDGLHQADGSGWRLMSERLGSRMQLVGDDLFYDFAGVLSPRNLLRTHADDGVANAMLIMPNRAGTLTSSISLIRLAQSLRQETVMAVRARETEDDAIVDIAAACGVGQLRCGGLQCTERNSKYDRLRLIEELLGATVRYSSDSLLRRGFIAAA